MRTFYDIMPLAKGAPVEVKFWLGGNACAAANLDNGRGGQPDPTQANANPGAALALCDTLGRNKHHRATYYRATRLAACYVLYYLEACPAFGSGGGGEGFGGDYSETRAVRNAAKKIRAAIERAVAADTRLVQRSWTDQPDLFGRGWPEVPVNERCSECGQPDNCGDCNHKPLTDERVAELGGVL